MFSEQCSASWGKGHQYLDDMFSILEKMSLCTWRICFASWNKGPTYLEDMFSILERLLGQVSEQSHVQ